MFDPFGIHSQINSMMSGMMGDPFAPPGNNRNNNRNNGQNNNSNNNRNRGNQVSLRNNFDPFGMNMNSPFDMHHNQLMQNHHQMANPFGMMNQMMSGMGGMGNNGFQHNVMNADPNSQVYSSSSVMTFTNANGKPKVYQQSTQVQQGPGGVKETRNLVRDSEKGIEKVSIGHHIGDKAHVIERQKEKGGNMEEIVNLENLDEDEINDFNKEFENKIRHSHMSSNYNQHQHRAHPHINSHQSQPFAIEDGHHGHRKERKSKSKPKHL